METQKMIIYAVVVTSLFICSCSQLLLKQSAMGSKKSFLTSMLDWRVLLAYGILFGAMVVNTIAYSYGLQLKEMSVLGTLGYVFVPLLSTFVLHENITAREIAAIILILSGIIVFHL